MVDWRTQLKGLLMSAPFLWGSLVGGIPYSPHSSCLASPIISGSSVERENEQSCLIRGYSAFDKEDLRYSVEIMEKLWNYFVEKAESFSAEEVAVIDKEFWNLG